MRVDRFVWDLDDDPAGNVQHIAQNGVSQDEVEEVLLGSDEVLVSESSGLPLVFGLTSNGRQLAVVFEIVEDEPVAVRPVTAFETES